MTDTDRNIADATTSGSAADHTANLAAGTAEDLAGGVRDTTRDAAEAADDAKLRRAREKRCIDERAVAHDRRIGFRELAREIIRAIDERLVVADVEARRELREELGVKADELIALGYIDLDTSIVSARVDLFIARGLRHGEKDEDATEQLETIEIEYADALGRVMESEITHAPSCVLLLKARDHLQAIS